MKNTTTLIVTCSLLMTLVGCSTAPKPNNLNELESLLKEPEVPTLKTTKGASKYLAEARQYEKLSVDAWKDGDLEEADNYALLGAMRYKTAKALYDRNNLQNNINNRNSSLEMLNMELQKLSKERNMIAIEVDNLKQQLIIAKKKKGAITSLADLAPPTSGENQATKSDNLKMRQEISQLIKSAKDAKVRAFEVGADKYAPKLYSLPLNKLNSIQTALNNNQPSQAMISELKEITKSFEDAYKKAEPLFKKAKERDDIPLRRNQLISELRNAVDPKTSVINTPSGSRVVFSALFPRKSGYLDSASRARVERVADIAKRFDDFNVLIEGFTAKVGSATEGLSTSQMRAQQVSKVFEEAGVPRSNIEWNGIGRTDFRFDPASSNENDRVEVVIQRF